MTMMTPLQEIIDYSGITGYSLEEVASDTWVLEIPYKDTVELSYIASFVSDLANGNFNVSTTNKKGMIVVKVWYSEEDFDKLKVESSYTYSTIKKWVDKLNKKLNDLQVEVEKTVGTTDYTKRNLDTKKYSRGNYGSDSIFYIINPEVNIDELLYIVDWLSQFESLNLQANWFKKDRIRPVADNKFLKSLGYSDNETYLQFTIPKNPTVFNPISNLKGTK